MTSNQPAELTADAGENILWEGTSIIIGGSETVIGGTPPYSFQWTPVTALDNALIANPAIIAMPAIEYTITVIDGRGCTSLDSVLVISSGINTIPLDNLILFPNPSSNAVIVDTPNSFNGSYDLSIFAETGELVKSMRNLTSGKSLYLDISFLSEGAYTILVQSDSNSATSKLIVHKK